MDGRLPAQAMDKPQDPIAAGFANSVRPRRCLNGPSNIASRHRVRMVTAGIGPCIHRKSQQAPVHLSLEKEDKQAWKAVYDLSRLRFALFAKEAHQFGSDFLCMGPRDAVRASFDDRQLSPFDQFRGPLSCRCKWHNAITVTVNDERGHVQAL